jgi:serine/threonine protein kinase
MMANLIGRILLNQFRVDAFLAAGGMGAVYRVWDTKRNVPLAMKILNADLAEDEHILKLFEREARALKRLSHPNIVSFYGLYNTPEFIFLLEQFVDGPSLKDVIKKRGSKPMGIPQAMAYLNAIASALGYAHANGVVHCDIKPGNVLIDRGGGVYLADFGIARHADSTTTTLGTLGTAAYMAPEQVRGEPVGPETDVYALGIMLFELLTGKRPFTGNELKTSDSGVTASERIRAAHLRMTPPDVRTFNPGLPVGLSAVIQKAMSKKRQERYSTASDFLAAVLAAVQMSATQVMPRVILDKSFYPEQHSPRQQQPVVLWFGLAAVVILGLGFMLFPRNNPPAPGAQTSPNQQQQHPLLSQIHQHEPPSLNQPTRLPSLLSPQPNRRPREPPFRLQRLVHPAHPQDFPAQARLIQLDLLSVTKSMFAQNGTD